VRRASEEGASEDPGGSMVDYSSLRRCESARDTNWTASRMAGKWEEAVSGRTHQEPLVLLPDIMRGKWSSTYC
jgi:hypothetical protein